MHVKPIQTLVRALVVLVPACVAADPGSQAGSSSTGTSSATTTSTTTSTEETGTLPPSPACVDWLICLGEIAPDELPAAEAQFGAAGSCWHDAETAAQCDATCSDDLMMRCTPGTSGESGDPPLKCSIEGLLPGTAVPIDAGDGEGQLPLEVGDVLARNCGCHYVDADLLDRTVPAYMGTIALSTWQDFHDPFMGQLTYERVQQRAVVELSMPPSFYCDALALGSLSTEDHALLEAWLGAGAPDGASWP